MQTATSTDLNSPSSPLQQNHFRAQELLIVAGLIAIPLLVFAQVRSFEFINYDDGSYVTKCPKVQAGLTVAGVKWAFSRDANVVTANWHPVTWLSLMSDVTLFGLNPAAFHLVNLTLHVMNVVLLFVVLRMLTGAPIRSGFVAVIFAVHPLHVESVAWVSERKDVLSTFFALSSIAMYLRLISTRRRRWLFGSLCCYILSLMSKQMFVTLPCLLVLLDYWPLCRIGQLSCRTKLQIGQQIREKILFFVVAILFCLIALVGQHDGGAVGTIAEYPPSKRVLNAAVVYVEYVWMTLFPRNLAVFYPYPDGSMLLPGTVSIVLLVGATIVVLRFRGQRPYLAVGWLWYVGTLVPVIGIVQIGAQRMADRYMYFPMIGLLVAFVWGAADIGMRFRRLQRPITIAGCAIVVILSICGHIQTSYWRDSLTLFSRSADVAKSSLAYTKLGFEQAQIQDFQSAATSLHRALAIDTNYTAAHRGLGNLHLAMGRIDRAASCFQRTLRLDPADAEAHYNLGIVFVRSGQIPEGIEHYEKAMEIAPQNAEIVVNLGTAYMMVEDHSRALECLEQALKLKPDSPEAQFNLAVTLKELGRRQDAIRVLLRLQKQSPDAPGLHERLSQLYRDLRNEKEAVRAGAEGNHEID